jgi:GGDEF domain-containing protein
VVVLENVGGPDRAFDVARRLRQRLISPPITTGDIEVDVSVGVAVSQPDDTTDSLLARADEALYRAKSSTPSKVVLHKGLELPTIT